jgi:hypothetical protein
VSGLRDSCFELSFGQIPTSMSVRAKRILVRTWDMYVTPDKMQLIVSKREAGMFAQVIWFVLIAGRQVKLIVTE